MLQRHLSESQPHESLVWEDLTRGLPTIAALANLCSNRLAQVEAEPGKVALTDLPTESVAILFTAQTTGSISIRGDKNAFEPGQRFLAICVEQNQGQRIEFRIPDNPQQTIRFMDGFRCLCRSGLVMHQLMNEFSLTAAGFALAKTIEASSVADLVKLGQE